MRAWDLEGLRIEAKYMGDFPVSGKVVSSRVKYGGEVQHTVELDTPIKFRWRTEPANRLLVEHKFITRVMS